MFRIRDLAVQSIEATSDDPKGNMLGFGPIYKILDTEGSRNPHRMRKVMGVVPFHVNITFAPVTGGSHPIPEASHGRGI
jgi:hypothetical protein